MECKVCGRNIRDDATKCPYCFASATPKTTTKATQNPYNLGQKASSTTKHCPNCGKEIPVTTTKCPYCLRSTSTLSATSSYSVGSSKKGLGIFLCLSLGILGLIIGLLSFPSGSRERDTFVSGWWTGLLIIVIFAVVAVLIATCVGLKIINNY